MNASNQPSLQEKLREASKDVCKGKYSGSYLILLLKEAADEIDMLKLDIQNLENYVEDIQDRMDYQSNLIGELNEYAPPT